MSKDGVKHDVIVVGAGVSGAVAARLIALREWDVLLVGSGDSGTARTPFTWISPYARPILEEVVAAPLPFLDAPIAECTFFSSDFSKSISPRLPAERPFVVDLSKFERILLDAFSVTESGHLEPRQSAVRIRVLENSVSVVLDNGSEVRGRLLVLATTHDSPLLQEAGLPVLSPRGAGLWTAAYTCPCSEARGQPVVDYVLGLAGGGFGYRIDFSGQVTVGLCSTESGPRAVGDLISMSNEFVAKGLLPDDWQTHAAGTSAEWSPAGLALEIENHVAKRAIAVGRAGGFVASFTNETLYPGIWSAYLASEVVCAALLSSQPQDKLRDFERAWRTTMADHLRAPNTDAQSLLPLVFSNQQMADKMLHSFHLGINF